MSDIIHVELYIREITDPALITDAQIDTLPAYRQKRIRSVKHVPTKAELFTAGLLLRDILGVSRDEDLYFSEQGKPYLKDDRCYFSLSHDDKYTVLATASSEIGVDIESRNEFSEVLKKRVFTEQERDFIIEDPCRNGLVLWTRLEAALKLSGEGIAGLDHRDFSLLEDGKYRYYQSLNYKESVISTACAQPYELVPHF